MTKGDLDGTYILERAVKPLAGIMAALMVVLVYFNIKNTGVFHSLWLGDLIAVVAGIAFSALFCGWLFRVQRMAELGLLLAGIVYIVRALFVVMVVGPNTEVFWNSFLIGLLSIFAFWLEAKDSTNKNRKQE